MKRWLSMMVCVMVAMVAVTPSYAQRLIPRQNSVELVGSMPIIKGEKLFAKESFGILAMLQKSYDSKACNTLYKR